MYIFSFKGYIKENERSGYNYRIGQICFGGCAGFPVFFSFIFISLRSETILLLLRNSVAWSIIVFLLHDLVSECRVVRSDVFIGHQINVVGEQGAPLMHWLQLER